MRLLNAETIALEMDEIDDHNAPEFAILSHTWGPPAEEILFDDLKQWSRANPPPESSKKRRGWAKVEATCRLALERGLAYVWIDTCCIDKSSSAVLQEAINSMFHWYEASGACFAYLGDVEFPIETPGEELFLGDQRWPVDRTDIQRLHCKFAEGPAFRASRWFTRGWTLQELLAPPDVLFFDREWRFIGPRSLLSAEISHITRIGWCYLDDSEYWNKVSDSRQERRPRVRGYAVASVAQKMSWVSRRRTTRREDMAYCLLGILGIVMPIIYGEGDNAFQRLQEEIIKVTDDPTILCWGFRSPVAQDTDDDQEVAPQSPHFSIFAPDPSAFRDCGNMGYHNTNPEHAITFSLNQKGLAIELDVVDDPTTPRVVYGTFFVLMVEDPWSPYGVAQRSPAMIAIPLMWALRPSGVSNHSVQAPEPRNQFFIRPSWFRPVQFNPARLNRANTRRLHILRHSDYFDKRFYYFTDARGEKLQLYPLPISFGCAGKSRMIPQPQHQACIVVSTYPPMEAGVPLCSFRDELETELNEADIRAEDFKIKCGLKTSWAGALYGCLYRRIALMLRLPALPGECSREILVVILDFEGGPLRRIAGEPDWVHMLDSTVLSPQSALGPYWHDRLRQLATSQETDGFDRLAFEREDGNRRWFPVRGRNDRRLVIEARRTQPADVYDEDVLAAGSKARIGGSILLFWVEDFTS